MPGIHFLKPVSLRKAWPHEAHNFTPWLVEHIDQLGAKLDLKLEQVRREVTLGDAGKVDICAEQAETGAQVVIENQLGESDNSHCLRLLGYAANAEASILVWVAREFTPYHQSILEWLNEADTIHVYAVTVHAYQVGDSLVADFQTVVEPPQVQPRRSSRAGKNVNTLYAEFYRPLVARLRRSGVRPVGKGGFRGRWRSFQSRYPGVVYCTGLVEGKAKVFLALHGAGHQKQYRALLQYREEIDGTLERVVLWREGSEEDWGSWVTLERSEEISLTGPEEDLGAARQWMAEELVRLRDTVQPYLDQIMGVADADAHEAEHTD